MSSGKQSRQLATGLGFLAPNILGFLAFTLFPLIYSMILAFSNWDLRLHNMFRNQPIEFTGFENFQRLFASGHFWHYLGNTLFLMMGIPLSIGGSLLAAIFLTQNLRGKTPRILKLLLGGAAFLVSAIFLALLGLGASAFTLVVFGLAGAILIGGLLGGSTVYRTLFYTPHFTAGVATFILWKKLYNPQVGPINQALTPVLTTFGNGIRALPEGSGVAALCVLVGCAVLLFIYGLHVMRAHYADGGLPLRHLIVPILFLAAPIWLAYSWIAVRPLGMATLIAGAAALAVYGFLIVSARPAPHPGGRRGEGAMLMLGLVLFIAQVVLIGLGIVCYNLPAMAAEGLHPPLWIADYHWAKPAIMIMGLWAAIGSNNMVLYIAGLSNIPPELYEASSIDGANRFQTFWNVTWPQLAPVTFFIFVMSVIGGLQGGFEMARTMTNGGPAGATTTLSYFVYTEGFVTGELGYASAVAWTLFGLVFCVTLFNWKFGNRYTAD